jgi:hypothetical protein
MHCRPRPTIGTHRNSLGGDSDIRPLLHRYPCSAAAESPPRRPQRDEREVGNGRMETKNKTKEDVEPDKEETVVRIDPAVRERSSGWWKSDREKHKNQAFDV